MSLRVAAIQMPSPPGRVEANLEQAEHLLERAWHAGAALAVLPELFATGYQASPDYARLAEFRTGPTVSLLARRSQQWDMILAGGFVETDGHHIYNTMVLCQPDGRTHFYRKRHLVFWETFRFRAGHEPTIAWTRFGRIGLAICADMIEARTWKAYQDRIDLALIASAWPEFAHRRKGRPLRLLNLGTLGPLCGQIPVRVAQELQIPVVFANQTGLASTTVPGWPLRIPDRFAGQSQVVDRQADSRVVALDRDDQPEVVLGTIQVPQIRSNLRKHQRAWVSTSPSAPAV